MAGETEGEPEAVRGGEKEVELQQKPPELNVGFIFRSTE